MKIYLLNVQVEEMYSNAGSDDINENQSGTSDVQGKESLLRMNTSSDPEAFGRCSSMEQMGTEEGGEDGSKSISGMSFFKGLRRSQSLKATTISGTKPGSKRYFPYFCVKAVGLEFSYATL